MTGVARNAAVNTSTEKTLHFAISLFILTSLSPLGASRWAQLESARILPPFAILCSKTLLKYHFEGESLRASWARAHSPAKPDWHDRMTKRPMILSLAAAGD